MNIFAFYKVLFHYSTLFYFFSVYTGPYYFNMGYLISYVLIMEQNFAFAFLYRSYLKIDVVIPAEPLGDKPHLLRITGQRGYGQRKMLELTILLKGHLTSLKSRRYSIWKTPLLVLQFLG